VLVKMVCCGIVLGRWYMDSEEWPVFRTNKQRATRGELEQTSNSFPGDTFASTILSHTAQFDKLQA